MRPVLSRRAARMLPRLTTLLSLMSFWACSENHTRLATVYSPDGDPVAEFIVFEANTAAMRRDGLRVLDPLAPGTGLLLNFPVTGEVCIVNGGVSYAIDAVFIGDPGDVVVAVERGIPALDESARCIDNVHSVLEVRAGEAANVSLGDRLEQHSSG